jgi:polar amino acid transport system substrate-binding protein
LVVSVFATSIRTDNTNYINNDSVQITLEFANGSIGNITYHALGDSSLPKEYFEVSGGGATAKLYDFKKTEITMRGKTKRINSSIQDKGFRNEYKDFLDAVMGLKPAPINYDSMYNTTLTTFRIMESLQTGIKLPV